MISGLDISRLKIPTGLPAIDRGMAGDVEAEGRLPETRPGGDHDEVLVVEASGHAVEVGETGVDPGDRPAVPGGFLDLLVGRVGEFARRLEAAADFAGRDPEDLRLRSFEDLRRTFLSLVAPRHQFMGELDQLARGGLLPDGPRVMRRR